MSPSHTWKMATKVLQVPKAAHFELVGPGGSVIKRIQGAHGVRITVPGKQDPSCGIIVSGPPAGIEAAEREMEAIVGFPLGTDPLVTLALDIPSSEHPKLIGSQGSQLRALEKESGTNIDVPRRGAEGAAVLVQGPDASVKRALAAIEALLHHKVQQHEAGAPHRQPAPKVEFSTDVAEAMFFSDAGDDDELAFQRFLTFLESTTKTMDVCIFNLTDDRISRVLLSLFAAGVKIRVIADNDQSESQGSDIAQLRSAGIPVRTDKSPAHMHHKFAVLDSVCLLNGSFNWTRGASSDNNENIMAIGAPKLVAAYAKEFERLWAKFE